MQCNAMHCTAQYCTAMHCNGMQYIALRCAAMQCGPPNGARAGPRECVPRRIAESSAQKVAEDILEPDEEQEMTLQYHKDPGDPGETADKSMVGPEDWSKTPRNASCPCGSGRRYKHCHGRLGQHQQNPVKKPALQSRAE